RTKSKRETNNREQWRIGEGSCQHHRTRKYPCQTQDKSARVATRHAACAEEFGEPAEPYGCDGAPHSRKRNEGCRLLRAGTHYIFKRCWEPGGCYRKSPVHEEGTHDRQEPARS